MFEVSEFPEEVWTLWVRNKALIIAEKEPR
jgi:hypothetical protein